MQSLSLLCYTDDLHWDGFHDRGRAWWGLGASRPQARLELTAEKLWQAQG